MDKRTRYILITILSVISFTGFSQKVPRLLQARAEDQVKKTVMDLEQQFNSIYTPLGETEFRFDSTAMNKVKKFFYKYNDAQINQISPNIIDPARAINKSVFHSDTNYFLPENTLIPVSEFLDTLKAWYCNDSCMTELGINIFNPIFDWDNYYYDPQLLCMRVYYTVNVMGEPYIPRLKDLLQRTSKINAGDQEFDELFDVSEKLTGQTMTSGTIIFLFMLDGDNIKSTSIYRIYDNLVNGEVYEKDKRDIISARNKLYLSVRPYLGSSILKAEFSGINNFEQTDEFQPYFGIHVDVDYYFNDGPRRFTKGLSAGVGISRFNTKGTVNDYATSFSDTFEPFGNQQYTKYVYADNIQEDLTLNYVDVNILFKLRYRLFKNVELIGSIGPQASFLSGSKIDPSTGTDGFVKYEGLFDNITFPPDNHTESFLLQDVPEYGFTTYTDLSYKEDEVGINKFNFCAYADLGLNFKLSHKFHLAFGVGYLYGFGNLVSESSSEDFVLSRGNGEVDNLFKDCTSLKVKAPSVFISATYLLNSKIK
jgi:hypothetical protein